VSEGVFTAKLKTFNHFFQNIKFDQRTVSLATTVAVKSTSNLCNSQYEPSQLSVGSYIWCTMCKNTNMQSIIRNDLQW
jgi:hypothetical protein